MNRRFCSDPELRHNTVVKIMEGEGTREQVARSILENGPSTAATLSQRLGITPAGIRRHTDALIADGYIEAREPHSALTKGRGRPSKVFVLTDSGRQQFEHSYDDLAISALRFMAAKSGSNLIDDFARARAMEMEKKISAKLSKVKDPEKAFAQFLSDEGYSTTVRQMPVGQELCQHHCPVAHVAAEFPQICDAETEMFSRVLGTHVQRLATIANGDGVCTTFVPSVKTINANSKRKNK